MICISSFMKVTFVILCCMLIGFGELEAHGSRGVFHRPCSPLPPPWQHSRRGQWRERRHSMLTCSLACFELRVHVHDRQHSSLKAHTHKTLSRCCCSYSNEYLARISFTFRTRQGRPRAAAVRLAKASCLPQSRHT